MFPTNTSFLEPCNEHDRDYDRCKTDANQTDEGYKAVVDVKFLDNMEAVCKDGRNSTAERNTCIVNAGIYQCMVDPGIINDSYRAAQLNSCKCCPPATAGR